jgi:transglutaminase-like putative cysteine protease
MDTPLINYKFKRVDPKLLWLFSGISLAVLPHSLRIPLWVSIAFIALATWRLKLTTETIGRYRTSLSLQFGKFIIFMGIVTGIMISYGTLVGRDAGVSFLILLGGMKVLECRQERDQYIVIYISIFLVLSNFLFTQSLPSAIYMLVVVTILIAAMISFNDDSNFISASKKIREAGMIILQAIPLLLVLFILFPRVPGPLWGLPRDVTSGISGLSDEMMPGSINELALSNEIAFRVKFESPIPEFSSMYWRGPVLLRTDGFKWTTVRSRRLSKSIIPIDQAIDYTVTLEPTNQNWLFGLEMPVIPPEQSQLRYDMQIRKRSPITNLTQYTMRSWLQYEFNANDAEYLQEALQLPENYHAKTRALANQWREEDLSSRDLIQRALTLFSEEEFYYTLSPPLLLQDTVDEFLFETRSGFCEHFAAAFVILMRAAGLPSRVVTGYQGGTINPIDNYLVVRQRDAHAWAEVYVEDEGWIRVDPTAAVAPSRILGGIQEALPQSIIDIPLGLQNSIAARNMWRQFRDTYEAVNNGWNQWVLSYDQKRQLNFFRNLGLRDINWRGLSFLLAITILMVIFFYIYLIFRERSEQRDKAKNIYDDFCVQMAKLGIHRASTEGPSDFARRAIEQRIDLKSSIIDITDHYIAIRYANDSFKMTRFKDLVRKFKPRKHLAA